MLLHAWEMEFNHFPSAMCLKTLEAKHPEHFKEDCLDLGGNRNFRITLTFA